MILYSLHQRVDYSSLGNRPVLIELSRLLQRVYTRLAYAAHDGCHDTGSAVVVRSRIVSLALARELL
jgi:hypothetical protein